MQSKPMTEIISIRFYNDRGSELRRATTQMKLFVVERIVKYSLQGTTQGRYLTGGVPPVRFSM